MKEFEMQQTKEKLLLPKIKTHYFNY